MLSDSDPAIVMLPDGTIRLFTPPARDAAAEPPSAAYSDSDATDDSRAAGITVRGLRLSPPPTPPARIRCGDADAADVESAPGAQSESEHTEAHSESALASTSSFGCAPTLESPRPSPFLTAADVLREFPRHYLALSSPDPPFSPGVSAIPPPGDHMPLPPWRPLVPGATYHLVPHATLRQGGKTCSARSLLRTFASCPERFDSATQGGDRSGAGGSSCASNNKPSRGTSIDGGDPAALPGTTHSASCTRYKVHRDSRLQNCQLSQPHTMISRSVSYTGPHTACDSPWVLHERERGGNPVRNYGIVAASAVGSGGLETGDVPSPLVAASSLTLPESTPTRGTRSGAKRLLRKVRMAALLKWFHGSTWCSNDFGCDCCYGNDNSAFERGDSLNIPEARNGGGWSGSRSCNIISISRSSNTTSSISCSSSNTPSSSTLCGGRGMRHQQPDCCSSIMRSTSLFSEHPFSPIEICFTADSS
ncbi:hypothetical protein CLOM_g23211 [Closterium sp. NIES-68]|nr:hypothetical protein CLOM_g23211 [Closterium sp. NIES-68]